MNLCSQTMGALMTQDGTFVNRSTRTSPWELLLGNQQFLENAFNLVFSRGLVLCAFVFFVGKINGDRSNTCLHCFGSSHHHPAADAISQTRDACNKGIR